MNLYTLSSWHCTTNNLGNHVWVRYAYFGYDYEQAVHVQKYEELGIWEIMLSGIDCAGSSGWSFLHNCSYYFVMKYWEHTKEFPTNVGFGKLPSHMDLVDVLAYADGMALDLGWFI